jgi:hypothetical protein
MDWLRRIFAKDPEKAKAKMEKRARKRQSKIHSQRVRRREEEIRRGKSEKPKFFIGYLGQTSQSQWRGPPGV